MRASLFLLLPTTLFTLTTSLAIEKRHNHAWPKSIRSFYTAVSNRLSTIAPDTLSSLTSATCNIGNPSMPTIPNLPPVTEGLTLYHVAIGRGTQNYTCDPKDPNSIPVAAGASATLYNTTCMSSIAPLAMAQLTGSALSMPTPKGNDRLFPAQAFVSGQHYFTGPAPTFISPKTNIQQRTRLQSLSSSRRTSSADYHLQYSPYKSPPPDFHRCSVPAELRPGQYPITRWNY